MILSHVLTILIAATFVNSSDPLHVPGQESAFTIRKRYISTLVNKVSGIPASAKKMIDLKKGVWDKEREKEVLDALHSEVSVGTPAEFHEQLYRKSTFMDLVNWTPSFFEDAWKTVLAFKNDCNEFSESFKECSDSLETNRNFLKCKQSFGDFKDVMKTFEKFHKDKQFTEAVETCQGRFIEYTTNYELYYRGIVDRKYFYKCKDKCGQLFYIEERYKSSKIGFYLNLYGSLELFDEKLKAARSRVTKKYKISAAIVAAALLYKHVVHPNFLKLKDNFMGMIKKAKKTKYSVSII